MDRPHQKKIDFNRAEQLAMIRTAAIDSTPTRSGNVSAHLARLVLRLIDDHGGGRVCWLSFETLAREAGVSVRQAKRAVEALQSRSLIAVERRRTPAGPTCNHYSVVWSELCLLCPDRRPDDPNRLQSIDGREPTKVTFSPTKVTFSPTQSDTYVTRSAPEAPKEPPPPAPSIAVRQAGSAAVGVLVSIGVATAPALVDDLIRSGLPVSEIESRSRTASAALSVAANRRLFRRPAAAAAYFVRFGIWPAEGVQDPAAAAGAVAAKRDRIRRQFRSSRARELIHVGRRSGHDDDTICAALAAEGLGWDG